MVIIKESFSEIWKNDRAKSVMSHIKA